MSSISPDPPIGIVVDARPARRPEPVTLHGRYAVLEPLDPARHQESLYEAVKQRDDVWLYLWEPPPVDGSAFDARIRAKAESTDRFYFAIVEADTGAAAGYASYLRMEPTHRSIEVGDILFAPRLQRTRSATEAMYLMARHAFEGLGYRRYEWKCDALNAPSMRAALRLGFTYEGTFRQHMIVKGRNRDTAWFSMIDFEWPARKAAFERWLDPANFDVNGRQRASLQAFGAGGSSCASSASSVPKR